MFKKPHNKYLYLILIFLFIFLLIKKHFKSYDQLGILKGEHFLTKSLYYEGYFIGGVRLVQSLPDKKVAIFGQKDGVILNVKNNTLKAAVAFQRKAVLKPEIVDVENDADATAAIEELNGKDVQGRAMVVNEAKPKKEGERGERGGEHLAQHHHQHQGGADLR